MKGKGIEVSEALTLPVDYITQRGALLAVSGAGKSNAARVIAEEFFAQGLPFVAVDPKGDWWGLRAGKDGKPKGGLGVVIFGGKHGDVPLEREGGKVVADAVVDQRLSCVLDLSQFESEAAKRHFLLDFASRLYFRNEDPLHLFLDEADDYIPQKPREKGEALKLLGMMENIVRRGRSKGIGITLISQRSAVLNKDVLYMAETLFALRTSGPGDIATVESWMKYHGADRAMLATLAGLKDGEAWVWSPHYLGKMERFRFRLSHTYDSGATPKNHAAKARRAAATLADVDLKELGAAMAEAVERAKADDPKALRARIAELEKQLRTQKPAEPKVERVEVPVFAKAEVALLERLSEGTGKLAAQVEDLVQKVKAKAYDRQPPVMKVEKPDRRRFPLEVPEWRPREGKNGLGKCARALLAALVQHGDLSLQQAAIIAGYPGNAPIVVKSAGELRSAGLIVGTNGLLCATDEGRASPELKDLEPLPTGGELAAYWKGKLGKCEVDLLDVVLAHHPKPVSLVKAAESKGYDGTQPIVVKSAGRLRTLELVYGTNAALTANERLVS